MGLEDIIEKIKQDTDEEINSIERNTQKVMNELKNKYESEIQEFRKKKNIEIQEKINKYKQHKLMEMELELKKKYLKQKNFLIQKIIEEAFSKMESLPEDEKIKLYEEIITPHIKNNSKLELILSPKEKNISYALTKKFKNIKIINEERSDFSSGVIIRIDEKKEINYSLEAIFKKISNEAILEIHKKLFPQDV